MKPVQLSEAHSLPHLGRYEVVVCGGGPAGIGAATMAARHGARTLLIERLGHVGGMHTSVGVASWCESAGGPVFDDLLRRSAMVAPVKFNHDPGRQIAPGRPSLDTETSKAICLEMMCEAGVDVLFLAFVESAVVENDHVRGVVATAKGGRYRIDADVVVDCTADADVATSAGAPFEMGDAEDGRIQHCNFRVQYQGVDRQRFLEFAPGGVPNDLEAFTAKVRHAHAQGHITPPENIFNCDRDTFPINKHSGALQFSGWEFENVDPTDAMQMSRLLVQCTIAAKQCMLFYREHVPGFERCCIGKLPATIGTRESRRIRGLYTLTAEEVRQGCKFQDGISRGWFWLDMHDSPPGLTIPYGSQYIWNNRPAPGDWFEVPYRCLVPQDTAGLLVAGRCISADRLALGATRIMPTCMFLGSAAGMAASLASKKQISPHEIDGREVRPLLFDENEQTPAACEAFAATCAAPTGNDR